MGCIINSRDQIFSRASEAETEYEDINGQDKKIFKLLSEISASCRNNNNKVKFEEKLLFIADYAKKYILRH